MQVILSTPGQTACPAIAPPAPGKGSTNFTAASRRGRSKTQLTAPSRHLLNMSCARLSAIFLLATSLAAQTTLRSLSDSLESLSRTVNTSVVQVFSTGYALADEESASTGT